MTARADFMAALQRETNVERRRRIVALLAERGPMNSSQLAKALGVFFWETYPLCSKLERDGGIVRVGKERGSRAIIWRLA